MLEHKQDLDPDNSLNLVSNVETDMSILMQRRLNNLQKLLKIERERNRQLRREIAAQNNQIESLIIYAQSLRDAMKPYPLLLTLSGIFLTIGSLPIIKKRYFSSRATKFKQDNPISFRD